MLGGEIDYKEYGKAMRTALSGQQISKSDGTLNHQYFNAKKGFYWSENNNEELINGICSFGTDW